MSELKRAAIVVNLLHEMREVGSWCGETHIQKSVLFLQELQEIALYDDFILYKHGPFSFDLRDELAIMRANGFLEIKVRPQPYGPSLIPTPEGVELLTQFPKTITKVRDVTCFVARQLGSKRVAELERLATALYFVRKEGLTSLREYVKRFSDAKPHVSQDEAIEAKQLIDQLLQESFA